MLDFIFYILCIIVTIFFVIPITVYLIVKVATVAFYETKKQFTKEERKDEQEKRT